MEELTLPIATLIASETVETDNESHYKDICEKVKHLREQVSEFYESEPEFIEAIGPVEQDPQSFTSGKPILKKYAHALLEKMELERQLEAEEEAKHLTPQQVKADLLHYVSTCDKKIAKQQEQCDALQKQVEQLMDVVKVLVTYPHLQDVHNSQAKPHHTKLFYDGIGGKNSRLLSHCAMMDTNMMDYFIDQGVEIESEHYSALHYAIYAKHIDNVKKLLDAGANVNHESYVYIDGSHKLFTMPRGSKEVHMGTGNYIEEKRCGTPLEVASLVGSLEIVKLLIEKGATIREPIWEYRSNGPYQLGYKVPNGPEGDLVAGYLQTHGSKPVVRF